MTELAIQKNNSNHDAKLWWKPMLTLQNELTENFKHMTSKLNPLMPGFWKFEDKMFNQMQKSTHQIFSEMFNNRQMTTPWLLGTLTEPYVNIIENGNKYKIQADMPGVNAKNIQISSEDNVITIKGSHSTEEMEDGDTYIRRECHTGSFTRTIALPVDADTSKAKANLEQSVLYIEVPKAAQAAKPNPSSAKKTLKDIEPTSIPVSQKGKTSNKAA